MLESIIDFSSGHFNIEKGTASILSFKSKVLIKSIVTWLSKLFTRTTKRVIPNLFSILSTLNS